MSLLQRYLETENQIKALQEQLSKMESDERLKDEVAFKEQLEQLMKDFNKSNSEVVALLAPSPSTTASSTGQRKKRKLKVYKNPETGEVVETRGGNHKTLKAWKEEHGAETVESWLVQTES